MTPLNTVDSRALSEQVGNESTHERSDDAQHSDPHASGAGRPGTIGQSCKARQELSKNAGMRDYRSHERPADPGTGQLDRPHVQTCGPHDCYSAKRDSKEDD